MRFIGNGRFRETNESSDGFDRVPSKKDERTERQILSSCRWARMYQCLLLVCARKTKAKKFPSSVHKRLAHRARKGKQSYNRFGFKLRFKIRLEYLSKLPINVFMNRSQQLWKDEWWQLERLWSVINLLENIPTSFEASFPIRPFKNLMLILFWMRWTG